MIPRTPTRGASRDAGPASRGNVCHVKVRDRWTTNDVFKKRRSVEREFLAVFVHFHGAVQPFADRPIGQVFTDRPGGHRSVGWPAVVGWLWAGRVALAAVGW